MTEKPTNSKDRDALASLNPDYSRNEKMFRMHTGCSTQPVSYKNGIIEIEIRLPNRFLERTEEPKKENVIRQLVELWFKAIPEAQRCRAHIYNTGRAKAGFSIPASEFKDRSDKDAGGILAREVEEMLKAERIDVKLEEREWLRPTD